MEVSINKQSSKRPLWCYKYFRTAHLSILKKESCTVVCREAQTGPQLLSQLSLPSAGILNPASRARKAPVYNPSYICSQQLTPASQNCIIVLMVLFQFLYYKFELTLRTFWQTPLYLLGKLVFPGLNAFFLLLLQPSHFCPSPSGRLYLLLYQEIEAIGHELTYFFATGLLASQD